MPARPRSAGRRAGGGGVGMGLRRGAASGNKSVTRCDGAARTAWSIGTPPAMSEHKLILASGSPRRHELLRRAGIEFEIVESGVEELLRAGESGAEFALRMAAEKAIAVSAARPGAIVLAADTIVACGARILGKPADPAEARAMLSALAGVTHTVVTAFAIACGGALAERIAVSSRVTFRTLTAAEIDAYVASGESLDKAGAYGIQGRGADFIVAVEGTRDNVMGLPVAEVIAALARHGVAPKTDRDGMGEH